jgi:hypothetical protein
MKCPHCNGELEFLAPVFQNCEIYEGNPKGVTTCCGNIVMLHRRVSFVATIPYNHDELKKDDWLNPKTGKPTKKYENECHSDEKSVFSAMQEGTDGG